MAAKKPLHEELREAIEASGKTQREVAKALGINEGNLSNALSGRRPVGARLAQRIYTALGVDSPDLTDVRYVDREPPLIPLEDLPMDVHGPEMARALRKLTKQRLPALTGDKGLFYVLLRRRLGWYRPNTVIFIAPHRKLVPRKRVLARFEGRYIVGRYQLHEGIQQIITRDDVVVVGAEILGRIVGALSWSEGEDE